MPNDTESKVPFLDYSITDQALPIPLQTFLWKQLSPFIRPKLGKHHEASCTFCQQAPPGHHELKEACKLFEKVLVQNNQFGLKPDVIEAIRSIPRWRLIQASLPHVMHCTASLLHNKMKDGTLLNLGAVETKLLYTLHWILLDAAEECADADFEKGLYQTSPFYYLFSIPSITLFIYLFAPVCHLLKESDFQTFRLENGLKLWQAMWEFRHPDSSCFTTHCKPKPKHLGKHMKAPIPQFGDVFLGRKPSNDEIKSQESPSQGFSISSSDQASTIIFPPPGASVTVTATITTKASDDDGWVSSPKDTVFPETIPEESSSTEEEHVVIFRLPSLHESDGFLRDPSIYTAETNLYELGMARNGTSKSNLRVEQVAAVSVSDMKQIKPSPTMQKLGSITDKDSYDSSKRPSTVDGHFGDPREGHKGLTGSHSGNLSSATFLDVAVLRCLFIAQWQEEGVYWALHFLYTRLREIGEEIVGFQQPRRRSNSLPIPKIEVSIYQSPEFKRPESSLEVPEVKDLSLLTESPYHSLKQPEDNVVHTRRLSEKTKKKMKITDLKTFVETKILSKSEKTLENIGHDEPKPLGDQVDYHRSLDTGDEHLSKPSCSSKMFQPLTTNLVKGKSMPSLRHISEIHWDRKRPSRMEPPARRTANPIITVTEHTPTPSPDYMRRQGSIDSQLDALSFGGSKQQLRHERKASLTRSQTDSNITYSNEDIPEAPGSICYITKDGDIDIQVVLKATHAAVLKENHCCTIRVLEMILNLVELLIDLGVLKQHSRDDNDQNVPVEPTNTKPNKGSSTTATMLGLPDYENVSKIITPHRLIMSIVVRVLKHLGCPHGCIDGQRGPTAEFLRTQCQNLLSKLCRCNGKQFGRFLRDYVNYRKLSDVLDVFHAYLGFCIDPSSLLSPLNQKRGSSKSPDNVSQSGYATNFGTGLGGSGVRGVEGQVMGHVFKALISRFVSSIKEIKAPENLSMYCEVRQLITYVKEAHGSTFRRVALSALIDTSDRPNSKKQPPLQTTRVIRHIAQPEPEVPQQDDTTIEPSYDDRSARKLLFKKRSTSSTCALAISVAQFSRDFYPMHQSMLETEVEETSKLSQSPLSNVKKRHILTQRPSEKNLGASEMGSSSLPKPRSKTRLGGIVDWIKRENTDGDSGENLDSSESAGEASVFSKLPNRNFQKTTFKGSTGNVGYSIQKAKRRMEDKFNKYVLKKGKKKDGRTEEPTGSHLSRRNSFELGDISRESEYVVLKERRLVDTSLVLNGMQRLSFMLETCPPGSIPDAHLLAASLDLPRSSCVARAAMLLECSHFVHSCNRGQWPSWMKLSFPMFRPSGPIPNRGPPSGIRRSHITQRTAGKLFYQWAELLGSRLEEMMNEDKNRQTQILNLVLDENKQKELLEQDEEEDYLDEASINTYGASCPMSIRLIACMLLCEITTFLRETYQTLPKSSRMFGKEKPPGWDRMYSKEANRRWSMALSSMGHSQTSAQSLQSIVGDRESGQTERKISFVVNGPENGSEGSNTTLVPQAEESKRLGQNTRPYLLRRSTAATAGGSFKRRSLKLRRGTKEGKDMETEWKIPETVKRTDSIQSKRKVSSLSDRSDNSEPGATWEVSGEESPGILSDDQPPESPSDANDTDDTTKNMPWLKVMVQVSNSFYFYCTHQNFCHPYCYRRVMRATSRLIKAVRKVYGEEFGVLADDIQDNERTKASKRKKDKTQNRKVSDQTSSQVSPVRRKDSMAKRDRIDKNITGSQASKLASKESSKDLAESDVEKDLGSSKNDKPKEPPPILKYIQTQVRDGFHAPLAVLLKGAVILSEENFLEIMPIAWELLLEWNQEVAACAASLFILCSVKVPVQVSELMHQSLTHPDPNVRINSILRFQVLWKLRYQVWPRMEENAHMLFKVPPPGIEFTLPSPKIGIECLEVVDSPWKLHVKTTVEEVALGQEQHRSFVTATKSRKKQKAEMIKRFLQSEAAKKREERENFLITTIPITIQAGHEPSLYHTGDEHEDLMGDDEPLEGQARSAGHHLHVAHSLFPSCLCSAVIQIISLLDDAAVSGDGNAVYEVAYQVIWCCLVEDSALFLRYILEKLTREKQDHIFKILRHMIRFIPKLPQQAAFALYNYIIGYVMFYVRTPHEEGQKLIGTALSLLWMVVHSVQGIMFKDLKQILRKEQCDASILLTANVPSAKKIIVHGPQDPDAGGIPSQFPVQEDTQFGQILREALDFFGIEECHQKEFFLVDFKTHQIRNQSSYVRDFYFFKRSQYPQLELIHMKPEEAFNALQQQELTYKFVEIGKVLLTWAILKNVDMVVQRVVFLHEELMKLPSFPRKALESNLDLYKGGEIGKELMGLDVLHKFMWIRLISRMFEAMAGNFAYSGDIHLFLNVLNGSFMLHSEDSCILRYVVATYINAAFHFRNIFALNGYLLIMPTLLKIYSNHQTNKLVTTTVEYAVKQFYLMNRKPFILQMFGSLSAMLDTDEEGTYGDANKIQSSCLFNLLLSLETPSPDPLNIGELVKEDKPLKAIDFCYHDEDEMVTILDCISLCVMVVSYSSDSNRGNQMLIILEAIVPCYVQHIQLPSYNKGGKTEKEIINQLAIAIRTLVNNCEPLTKSYNGPYRSSPEHKGSSQRNYSRGPYSPGFDFEDESHSKFMSEHSRAKTMYEHDIEDSEALRAEYRRPRDVLLSLVGEFVCRATNRLTELNKKNSQDSKIVELLDAHSHVRLADIAHALLKLSPYDPESMACKGLQHYMNYILPSTEWSNDSMRPALITIVRRLDKVFLKISKKYSIRRNTDWDAAAGLLKGVYETMQKYTYIMHWQHVKGLINTCQALIIGDGYPSEGVPAATTALMNKTPPPHFCSMVVRLIALQILNPQDTYTLDQAIGGTSSLPTPEKAENLIMNLLMPLCLRVGSGRKDITSPIRPSDRSHAIQLITNSLNPPNPKLLATIGQTQKGSFEQRPGSPSFASTKEKEPKIAPVKISESLYRVSFLALKLVMVCFDGDIIHDWFKIYRTMRELLIRDEASDYLWDFIDFVVTHRTVLFLLMQPVIAQKLRQPLLTDFDRTMNPQIKDKLRGIGVPLPKSRGSLLMELAHEMKELKEELEDRSAKECNKRPDSQTTVQMMSEISHARHQRPSLIEFFTGGESGSRHGSKVSSDQFLHMPHGQGKESSSSASYGSTPNQGNASISEAQEPINDTFTSFVGFAPVDRSQQSSVNDEHGIHKTDSQHRAHKLRFVSSVELRHSSGETSTTPLSPSSPADDSSSEMQSNKPRLQRVKAQSRKTFRFRKSRKATIEVSHINIEPQEILTVSPQQVISPTIQSPAEVAPSELSVTAISQHPLEPHRLRIASRIRPTEGSWDEDSAISQTSSTSGYRESYTSMQLAENLETLSKSLPPLASPDLPSTSSAVTNYIHADNSSPDCSLNDNGERTALLSQTERSPSQQSLLMIFDAQDETTLI